MHGSLGTDKTNGLSMGHSWDTGLVYTQKGHVLIRFMQIREKSNRKTGKPTLGVFFVVVF